MPAEKFYYSGQFEGDGREPDLTIAWGGSPEPAMIVNGVITPAVLINGDQFTDRAGLNRLIRALRKARDQVFGADE